MDGALDKFIFIFSQYDEVRFFSLGAVLSHWGGLRRDMKDRDVHSWYYDYPHWSSAHGNGEEMSLRQIAMVAKFLNLSKPWFCKYGGKNEKLTCLSFLFMTALR